MGKPLQFTTIALAIIIATIIQLQMARAATEVECLRKSHSHLGFQSPAVFEAWFPRAIYLYPDEAQMTEGGRLKFSERSGYYIEDGQSYWLTPGVIWEMLPDGRLFGFFPQKPGYVQITTQRYDCDATVEEILASR